MYQVLLGDLFRDGEVVAEDLVKAAACYRYLLSISLSLSLSLAPPPPPSSLSLSLSRVLPACLPARSRSCESGKLSRGEL